MNIINLTPHPLRIRRADGSFLDLPKPAGQVPRLVVSRVVLGSVEGVTVVKSTVGSPEGLPPAEPGTTYVVSRMIVDAAPGRDDLVSPGEAIRDADGKVIGADGFSK